MAQNIGIKPVSGMARTLYRTMGLIIASGIMALALIGPASAKTGVVLAITLEPPHLDPTAGAPAAIDEVVYANLFEGLTRIDALGQVKPGLAERWVIEDLSLYPAQGRDVS